jgi:hypothetical protein
MTAVENTAHEVRATNVAASGFMTDCPLSACHVNSPKSEI